MYDFLFEVLILLLEADKSNLDFLRTEAKRLEHLYVNY